MPFIEAANRRVFTVRDVANAAFPVLCPEPLTDIKTRSGLVYTAELQRVPLVNGIGRGIIRAAASSGRIPLNLPKHPQLLKLTKYDYATTEEMRTFRSVLMDLAMDHDDNYHVILSALFGCE
ncbi:hypothetical protein [Roseomonas sp. WA12]